MKASNFVFSDAYHTNTQTGFQTLFCLNKPGWAGSFPFGGCLYGVAASQSGFTILSTFQATPHVPHRNHNATREVRSRATSASTTACQNQQINRSRTPNHPGQIAPPCRRNGQAVAAVAPGYNPVEAGNICPRFQQIND